MITKANLQQFFTSCGMILVFIAIKKSPLDSLTNWWVWLITGILLFVFAPAIAKKIKGEG